MALTLYWHDYETWGADPSRDRAAQFAGVRTDSDLNIIDRPLSTYCQPAADMLPQPDACLVTGITPQKTRDKGVNEAEFFRLVHEQLSLPGTCGVGFNSIRFDDEFTRYGLYRNFFDPYAREWKNGNSRWDIIDMVRLAHALRPEGIEWPRDEDGTTSFRLERLTAANGIAHVGAHDALSDVYATLDMARLVRKQQPRLFEYLLSMRSKRRLGEMLKPGSMQPVLHVSSMYPARQGCIAMVVPLARHPTNSNGVIVFDLRHDPAPLIGLGVDEIKQRLFTPAAELPQNVERIPLKTVHLNKSPVLVPMKTMTAAAAERWEIDVDAGLSRMRQLGQAPGLAAKVRAVHEARAFPATGDPDLDLYGGGFFSDDDRRRIDQVRNTGPEALGQLQLVFDDPRLPEMLFRYRARNWPRTLSSAEQERWEAYRMQRLTNPQGGGGITLDAFRRRLAQLMVSPGLGELDREVLSRLADWPAEIGLG